MAPPTATTTRYQHFIPQLLLRNFSHPYNPPKRRAAEKRGKSRPTKGKYKGDKVLHVVDLSADDPQLLEMPVARWFGLDNMYNDTIDTIKTRKDIEKELSKLECRTAEILQKIKKAYESDEQGIWLTRVERNMLRKFLFIMKYRGPGFYRKYRDENPRTYDAEDKNLVWLYMAEKKFFKPRDVWLHGLRTILDIDMDPKGKWMTTLPNLMFPGDAQMFIYHAQAFYMAICVPSDEHDEFILSEQCYNVFEGPTHETYDSRTGEYLGDTHTPYHMFAPISPRLVIVLRSFILPEAQEDADPKMQQSRQIWYDGVAAQFPNPEKAGSILADLPVQKASNSYSRAVNGRIVLASGESGIHSLKDRFCFTFWPILTSHVDTINSIFLDNLLRSNSIAFGSHLAFQRTLEAYMTTNAKGFKAVGLGEHGAPTSRLACLQKLSTVLKMLGSKSVPIWRSEEVPESRRYYESLDDTWLKMMKQMFRGPIKLSPASQRTRFWQAYFVLGGSETTFVHDLEQSWKWYRFQSQVYRAVQHCDDWHRQKVLQHFYDLLFQQFPRRVWLLVKHRRWMLSEEYAMHQEIYQGVAPVYVAKTESMFQPAPEDEIVLSKKFQ